MENLNEDINRIKVLMLIENDDQTSLFSEEGTPINLNSSEFTKRFKEKVFFILRDLYKSNWDKDKSRGPSGSGGIVGIHTVHDSLLKKGLTDYDPEGSDWSILNYFDTNPQVRRTLVGLFEKESGKVMDNTIKLEEFITWMSKNRNKLFKDGPILNTLIEKNTESLYQGELNERKAYDYLSKILENIEGWSLKGRSVPGSKSDRDGVDFVMVNDRSGKVAKFQAKPLNKFERINNMYKIKSYNIQHIDKKPVDYFVFASSDKDDVFIFKNTKGKYTILDKDTVQFEEPPIEF
jgi:hypothetical protein